MIPGVGSRRKRRVVVGSVATAVVLIALVASSFATGFGIPYHSSCTSSPRGTTDAFWLPLALLNAPYGGEGFLNSTFQASTVGYPNSTGLGESVSGGIANGTVWGGFVHDEATVYSLTNSTVLGPGPNTWCRSAYRIALAAVHPVDSFSGQIFTWPGGPSFGPALSDAAEPDLYNFSTASGDATSTFRNAFYAANSAEVSTCNGRSASRVVHVDGITTWIGLSSGGQSRALSLVVPVHEQFHYVFPADFGTWQIDNLSEPGGPGGGWAFSYAPCS
jgi:hypothetical protein